MAIHDTDRPDSFLELMRQSIWHRQENRLDDSLACLNRLLDQHPELHPCRFSRAQILLALGRYELACRDLDAYEQAMGASEDTRSLRALVYDTARAAFAARLANAPDDLATLREQADFLRSAGELRQAEAACDRILAQVPDDEAALFGRAYALAQLGRPGEALAAYEQLLDRHPAHALGWFNRGVLLQQAHRLHEALGAFSQAAELHPGFAQAYLEQAHCHLAQGNHVPGWALYEWRWQTPQLRAHGLKSEQGLWRGETPLDGKTLLLWSEQGLGDTLQFVRFVPRLVDAAGRVILLVPATLRTLLAGLDPRITVLSRDVHPLPEHDLHCPLMSLPLALRIKAEDLAGKHAYLSAPPASVEGWRDRLGQAQRPRIGLVWQGRQYGDINHTRDIPAATLAPLARLEADFISLQDAIRAEDHALLGQWPNFSDHSGELSDMAETAALLQTLDLVISADTAVAHLAGALGKPCCLLLRHAGEWRWQLEHERSPWYGSIRIFRQPQPGDWDSVIGAVCQQLSGHVVLTPAASGS